jgi:tRNA A37 methylthiotransferase MiaB
MSTELNLPKTESSEKQRSVYVITNGCTEGRMDSALLERFFQERADFRLCGNYFITDLVVFVGCCVTQDKEYLSRLILETLPVKKCPDAQILVTGCIARLRPELAQNKEEFRELVDHL